MNKDQTTGVFERVTYSVLLWIAMKFVAMGYIDPDMAGYIAAGGLALVSSSYAWWINRPSALLTAAGNQLPKNSALVITTTTAASHAEKVEAHALADQASDRVVAKTAA